eukprot:scaffold46619_cov68-Phaeocystis_antarctica.AAC.3
MVSSELRAQRVVLVHLALRYLAVIRHLAKLNRARLGDAHAVGGGGGHLDQPGGQDGARAAVAMERWHRECRHERER